MHPISIIELGSAAACLAGIILLICRWKHSGFIRTVPLLLLLVQLLMFFYATVLAMEWSGLFDRLQWHFIEDFASIFLPVGWGVLFYVFVNNLVKGDLIASRQHFRDLVESTSDWIWEVDAGGHYTYVSPKIRDVLGYEPEEVIGKTPFDLMERAEAKRISEVFARVAVNKEPFQGLVNVNLHKDGRLVTMETNAIPVFDDRGHLAGYRGIDRDITARLESEKVQKRQQAELHSLFKASPAGIGLIRNRYLVRGNERFFEITGYDKADLVGMDPRRLYTADEDYFAVGAKYAEALETGFARVETRFRRKDQSIVDVVLYLSPVDKSDTEAGFVLVIQDITALKAARQQVVVEKNRAQTYLDLVNVMILVLDDKGCVELLNKKGCELIGCSAEDVRGAQWFKRFLPPSYSQITQNAFDRLLAGDEKGVEYFENPIRTLSGSERLIAWRNTALRDEAGRIIGLISSGQDITEERAAEKALRQSEEQLRVALSAAQMGIWRWEVKSGHLMRDSNLNTMLGLPAETSTHSVENFFEYVHPDDRRIARAKFDHAIGSRGPYGGRFRVLRSDGRIIWTLIQGKPFYDFNGQLEYVTGVVVDVSEQAEYEQRYKNIISSAPMGILTYTLNESDQLVLTGANKAANTILGVSFSQSAGKPMDEIFTELKNTDLPQLFKRICKEGGSYHGDNFEYQDQRVGGCYEFDVFQTSVGNIAVAFNDVTERLATQQKLRESEAELHKAQRVARMGSFRLDLEKKVFEISKELRILLGFSLDEEITLEKALDRAIPEDRPLMTESIERAVKTGSTEQDLRFQVPDGQTLWLYTQAKRTLDSQGNVKSIFGIAYDITERKLAEQQREELLQKLQFTQFAFDNAGEAAHWVDFDENFIYVNDMDCEELGYTREEMMQMKVHDIDPFYERQNWVNHWNEMRSQGIKRFEGQHRRKDGTTFPVEITSKFFTYEGKEYICSFERDITERKLAEQQRETLMQQLHDRNDEMQSIVFTAAHDLRSPLVNIAGFTGEMEKGLTGLSEVLEKTPLDDKTAERIEFLLTKDLPESLRLIKFGNQQMDMLLGGLMRLSKIGSAPVKLAALDMNKLMAEVVDGFAYQVRNNGIDVSIQPDLPDCTGDYSLLVQLFINLMDNAIKYRHPDRPGVIKISAESRGKTVEYSVADNGIGIESQNVEKVFDLFHRLDRKSKSDGEGLGLTIVRRILDRIGGNVRIDSVPGQGTTVYIQLPG